MIAYLDVMPFTRSWVGFSPSNAAVAELLLSVPPFWTHWESANNNPVNISSDRARILPPLLVTRIPFDLQRISYVRVISCTTLFSLINYSLVITAHPPVAIDLSLPLESHHFISLDRSCEL